MFLIFLFLWLGLNVFSFILNVTLTKTTNLRQVLSKRTDLPPVYDKTTDIPQDSNIKHQFAACHYQKAQICRMLLTKITEFKKGAGIPLPRVTPPHFGPHP
jgi:hypothetical protein